MAAQDARKLVASFSERGRAVHARIGALVRLGFPQSQEITANGMPGWRIGLPPEHQAKASKAVMEAEAATLMVNEGKSGITVHFWDPSDYHALDRHREELEKAGFQVMVGCVRWTKKGEYPVEKIEEVLKGMKARLAAKQA